MKMKFKYIFLGLIITTTLLLVSCNNNGGGKIDPPDDNNVSIIFNSGDDNLAIDTLVGKPGDPILNYENPNRDGYRFSHWELNGHEYFLSVYPNSTIVLTAIWEKVYTINFEVGDSHEPVEPLTFLKDEPLDDLPLLNYKIDSNNQGYKFIGWEYNGVKLPFENMPEMDIVLDAIWEEANVISFDTGLSNDFIEPIFADSGKGITSPNVVPTLENEIFIGWFYLNKPYIFDKMPNISLKLEAKYLPLDSKYNSISTLPKMFINLENNNNLSSVNRENYMDSSITILSDDEDNNLISVASEFKGRGHGSWTDSGDKRGYRLKFFKKQSLFGEAKSKHWVLLAGANFYDPTLAKNATAFALANDVLSYIEYASKTYWVELYINEEYRGVYILAEQTRVDEDRVNVNSEFGVLDTGYLIEYDKYAHEDGPEGLYYFNVSGYKSPIAVKRPDPDDFLDEGISEALFREQVEFIKNYTTTVLHAAINKDYNAFKQYADVNSFIDMYLLHELFKNTDTGWSSFYMVKKPGGKLYATAPWDFDASAGKTRGDSSYTGFYVSDTVRQHSSHTASELYISLMEIPQFRLDVKTRWNQISENVKLFINQFLSDEFINTNKFAFGRNFHRWSGLNNGGDHDYGNYPSIESGETQWSNAVITLREWLTNRANWFDDNL